MITNIINFTWKHRNKITVIIMIILIILYWRQCGQIKYEIKKAKQNQLALTDTISVIKQKNGDLLSQKSAMVVSEKELKELNKDLYEEVKLLKEKGSKVKYITKIKIVYRDTGYVKNTVTELGKNKYSLDFDYLDSDGVLGVVGRSEFKATATKDLKNPGTFKLKIRPGNTYFDTIRINMGLIVGVKEDKDGVDRVFVKPNPFTDKIEITDVDAAQLEDYYKSKYNKKKKHFTVGPQIGLGVGMGSDGQFQLKPQIGIGLQYSFIKF